MAQLSPYTMQIKELAITELHEYENNPRNNDGAVDTVAASIEEFGFKVPNIIDSAIFIPIAFIGQMPFETLVIMGITQVCLKVAYEIVIIPLTTWITKKVAAQEAKADVA